MGTKEHFLYEVDEQLRRGICAQCGWVAVYATSARGKRYWRCAEAEKERLRAYPRDQNADENKRLIRLYGITLLEYHQRLEEQDWKCARCGRHQSEFKVKLAVDHCHKTGVVRKLLCPDCNTYLGKLERDRERLAQDLLYLDTGSFEPISDDN